MMSGPAFAAALSSAFSASSRSCALRREITTDSCCSAVTTDMALRSSPRQTVQR